jgi:hypothetical protein
MNETWQKSSYSMGENNCVETRTAWATSSYSASGAACVEVGRHTGERVVQVRDTKDHSRGTLNIGAQAWQEFIRL